MRLGGGYVVPPPSSLGDAFYEVIHPARAHCLGIDGPGAWRAGKEKPPLVRRGLGAREVRLLSTRIVSNVSPAARIVDIRVLPETDTNKMVNGLTFAVDHDAALADKASKQNALVGG